jgi:serine/threonine protein kinase
MVTENTKTGELDVTLIDFNVSKRFREEESNSKYLMMTNTGAAAFTSPEIHANVSYE